ncbi:MAG: hypothetical protein ACRCZO_10375 [Cetobacterium sp.]
MAHAYHLLKHKTGSTKEVQKVIQYFGLNNRDNNNPSLLQKMISHFAGVAKQTFPNARILIPLINFSSNLTPNAQRRHIKDTGMWMEGLPYDQFNTIDDNIHWTLDTGHSDSHVKSLAQNFKLNKQIGGQSSNKTIINLSDSLILNSDQLSLLEKGLSFAPYYTDLINQNRLEVQTQLSQYPQRLKLLAYFEDEQNDTKTPFLPTSKWEPELKDLPIAV